MILNNIFDIRNSKFDISPARTSKEDACTFCDFRDICYLRSYQRRILEAKEDDEDEVLG